MKKKLEDIAIVMNVDLDQVAVAKEDIPLGCELEHEGKLIKIKNLVKSGHRFALVDIKEGEFVRQYGYPFGQSEGIVQGESITVSNIKNVLPQTNLKDFKEPGETTFKAQYLNKTFLGYIRKNGYVGTRNYYLVVPTSMCASETALQVALGLENDDILQKYSHIDGIVAIPHTEGCGCDSGLQIERLLTVLKGYVSHPNVGGCLIMDLGCEQTNYERMYTYLKDTIEIEDALKPIDWITIQENGGTHSTIERAKAVIKDRLSVVNQVKREHCPLGKLIIGTECGASDSFSGITANPVIGNTVDKIIYGGGSAILSEVPEMLGTFNMLFPRFKTLEIANKFEGVLKWYIDIARKLGLTLEANLIPKNIDGGLINNYVKSLGAVMKGGTTIIEDIVEYAEPVRKRGLSIMQGPGGDLESVTGIVASGATIVCFSTGQGTTTGNAICPVIKVSSNDATFRKLPEDIDFNAGRLLTEQTTINKLGEELLEIIIDVASGKETWSERWKQRQFQVWTAGKLSL